jgi:hypothetical protein
MNPDPYYVFIKDLKKLKKKAVLWIRNFLQDPDPE